jgi:hypothetical protein
MQDIPLEPTIASLNSSLGSVYFGGKKEQNSVGGTP